MVTLKYKIPICSKVYLIVQGLHYLANNISIHSLKYCCRIKTHISQTLPQYKRVEYYMPFFHCILPKDFNILLPVVFYEILLKFSRPCHNLVINDTTLRSLSMKLFASALVGIIDNEFPK